MSTKIEWTRGDDGTAGLTWNPTTGCDQISPGCDGCYALSMARRLKAMGSAKYQRDGDPRTSGPGFGLTTHPAALRLPLAWKKPRRIFVDSMSDLFHRDVPDAFIENVFGVMARCPQHTFQVLTKRPQRMAEFLAWPMRAGFAHWAPVSDGVPGARRMATDEWPGWPLPNVHVGTSIESDRYAWRADHLRATPAAIRFLSLEPLLGPLPSLDLTGIDWVITGGESGPGARPMHPDWVRDLRDRCVASGVPFFFKQWGEWEPAPWKVAREHENLGATHGVNLDGHLRELGHKPWSLDRSDLDPWPWAGVIRSGKKAAGRDLDGRTWDEFPRGAS